METKRWFVDIDKPMAKVIEEAASLIKGGGLVAFPTETVYGLGANGLDSQAVEKIFLAKGRPSDNPLILHIAQIQEAFFLASDISPQARILMERFWPGPLTLVLPSSKHIPARVTAGLNTVAIRMPNHPVALALIRQAGVAIAAPSANRSGYPSPTSANHVWEDLAGRIEGIIDGGATGLGLESTVLDMSGQVPLILRPGGVTREELASVLGEIQVDPGLKDWRTTPRSPGMKYVHYSPRAQVYLVEGAPTSLVPKLKKLLDDYTIQGKKVGLLFTEEMWRDLGQVKSAYHKDLGSRRDLGRIAHVIYDELRRCDQAGVDIILTETYQEEGLGAALMNRLLKSAGYRIVNF